VDLADFAAQQAQQHQERREDGRDLKSALVSALGTMSTESREAHARLEEKQGQLIAKQAELSTQLAVIQAGGLGTWERRGILTGGLVVLLLLILLLATSRGVDPSAAVEGVRRLTPTAGAAESDPLTDQPEP